MAESAYGDFFRARLLDKQADTPRLIGEWCNRISEVGAQLSTLNNYLTGRLGSQEISLHFTGSSLSDDYRTTLLSLKLQPHLLALLIKFRVKFDRELHERFQHELAQPTLEPIRTLLEDVRRRAGHAAPQALIAYIDALLQDNAQPRASLSMLEVVERIQTLNWNLGAKWYQGFVDCCVRSFAIEDPGDFIGRWAAFQTADAFLRNVLYGFTDRNFRYILFEHERSQGQNLHFNIPALVSTGPIELEHVFAQNADEDDEFKAMRGFAVFEITDRLDYDRNVLWRIGNLTWLSKSSNDALGNQSPDKKAAHYCQCPGHPVNSGKNVCSKIYITRKLGADLVALGTDYRCFRLYVEARCAELALFSVRRLC